MHFKMLAANWNKFFCSHSLIKLRKYDKRALGTIHRIVEAKRSVKLWKSNVRKWIRNLEIRKTKWRNGKTDIWKDKC